jgi:hypothetical protein
MLYFLLLLVAFVSICVVLHNGTSRLRWVKPVNSHVDAEPFQKTKINHDVQNVFFEPLLTRLPLVVGVLWLFLGKGVFALEPESPHSAFSDMGGEFKFEFAEHEFTDDSDTLGVDGNSPGDSPQINSSTPTTDNAESDEALSNPTSGKLQSVLDTTVAASYWRLGMQADIRYGIRMPLFEKDSPLFQGTGLKALATLATSPAYVRSGGRVIFSPLAIVDLHLHGAYDRYFGNFQTVVGYSDATDNYGYNADIAEYAENTNNQMPGSGFHYGAQVVLKAKAGPVVVLASTDVTHMDISADVVGEWFFEREKELMLLLDGDSVIDFNGLVLYQLDIDDERMARFGSFTTWRASIEANDRLLRSGLLCSYTGGRMTTHNLIVQAYLDDRAFTETFPPYLAYALKLTK